MKQLLKPSKGKTRYYLVNGWQSTLTVLLSITAFMILAFDLLYIKLGIKPLGIICLVVLGLCLIYHLTNSGKIVAIGPNGVKLYALTKRVHIPWQELACSGVFFHYIYINAKKKYFYFGRKQVHFKENPLALNALPTMSGDFIYVMDQKGLEEVISRFKTIKRKP